MKFVAAIAKILAALAAVVGAIYLLATYGEQIVAWCKKVMAALPQCSCKDCDEVVEAEEVVEAPVEAPVVEEEIIEEIVVEEVPAENEVVADEADFVQE